MTVRAELAYVAALRDVPAGPARRAAVDAVLGRTGPESPADRRIGNPSRGPPQRGGLAGARVAGPPPLPLDATHAGVDPAPGAEMRQLIRTLGTDHAVFVSSHVLADVETLCDRVVVLQHGRILAEGTPLDLAARLRTTSSVDVEAGASGDDLERALATVPGVR